MAKSIAIKRFTTIDQSWFADASGDRNPLHMDSLAARRSAMGAPIIHGVHGVLWALEALCASERLAIAKVTASFSGPIYVGDTAEVRIARRGDDEIRLAIEVEGTPATSVTIGLGPTGVAPSEEPGQAETADWPSMPRELGLEDIATQVGAFAAADDVGRLEDYFPSLCGIIGVERLRGLAALSRLVGMVSPGLYSIFHSLSVVLVEPVGSILRYASCRLDERFRLLRMTVDGCGLAGDVAAFLRHPPAVQPTIDEIAARIPANAYEGATVLVVGGSRGLGEVVAKASAAGGAKVVITYATGSVDAQRVAAEIIGFGGDCEIFRFDARGAIATQLDALQAIPTHVYFFASGPIAVRKTRFLNADILADLMVIYATAFAETCELLSKARPVKAFYPSSVAIEATPKGWTEYAMAKAAGEVLCENLNARIKYIDVLSQRLPRIFTDQTASIFLTESVNVLDIMIPIVAKMNVD